ncbi:MAG TPA: pitrilysin family protein [Gammaproteobacteria bacterium]
MRRWLVAAALVGLGACSERPAPDESAATTMPASEDSSASTIVRPVPSDPTVAFSIWFKVGSQNDPPGKEGLAYLTGQMLADASTENNAYEEILELLYPIASGYGVRVDREMTTLTGRTHTDNVALYTGLYIDAFLRPAFEDSDFQRIKNDTINYLENELRYASDEELGKAALNEMIYAGTAYAHPPEGTVDGLNAITLDDVREFYRQHYTAGSATLALGGGFTDTLVETLESAIASLPSGESPAAPTIEPPSWQGQQVLIIDKPDADASISFGFPIDVHRGERDFYALWIANSWLGEHRNSSSHLFKVIREVRGLNYGDYSYIEAYPEGGQRTMPPVNVARRQQFFEIWIRTLPNHQAHFALRAAVRELGLLVEEGMTEEEFELTRSFLRKYVLHFAKTSQERLGYAVDDRFYGIDGDGHLARFRQLMDEITLEEVNAAIREHLRADNLKIAIVTGDAEGLAEALITDTPSPLEYESPKPDEVLAEDAFISEFPLGIDRDDITIVPVDEIFQSAG